VCVLVHYISVIAWKSAVGLAINVCVCERETDRQTERERQPDRERQTDRETRYINNLLMVDVKFPVCQSTTQCGGHPPMQKLAQAPQLTSSRLIVPTMLFL